MNKKILRQALLFEFETPSLSKIKELYEKAVKYQDENNLFFIKAKRREPSFIINETLFFQFISEEIIKNKKITDFEAIKNILNAKTRAENIKYSGDSKTNLVKIFDNTLLIRKKGELAKLYQPHDVHALEKIDRFVAIENGETFLNIDKQWDRFKEEYFIYIAGNPNTLTREFLKNKEILFFIDFDIASMNIFDSFPSTKKTLFIPNNIEELFIHNKNIELYKKQRSLLKKSYSIEVMPIINLIRKHHNVVEQEVL
jgi:hypothetical protein